VSGQSNRAAAIASLMVLRDEVDRIWSMVRHNGTEEMYDAVLEILPEMRSHAERFLSHEYLLEDFRKQL
jgi:hypothetical protein